MGLFQWLRKNFSNNQDKEVNEMLLKLNKKIHEPKDFCPATTALIRLYDREKNAKEINKGETSYESHTEAFHKEIYRNANDLKDKNVGAQKGSIQEELVKTQLKGAKLVTIDKVPNMIVEVNQGSLAATVVEKTIAESYIAQNPDLMIADISLEPAPDEAFAIALPKESSQLQKELNQIIKKLNDEGKIEEFIQQNNELAEKTAAE